VLPNRSSRRVAIVGIDGAGKSTVIRKFMEQTPSPVGEVEILHCPLYHESPNVPFAQLSRELDGFSRASDALGSFEMKAVAMFYQMTLYGPVERFYLEELRPQILLSDRHALVDSLAYGPFYLQMVRKPADRDRLERPLRERLNGAWESVHRWHERESHRLSRSVSLWDLPLHVTGLFRLPFPELVLELSRQYRTSLPDVVLLLDVPGAVAQERIAQRAGAGELHEQTEFLEALRRSYHRVMEALKPLVETHVIDAGSGSNIDRSFQEVVSKLKT